MKKIRTKIIMAILMCSLLTAAVIGTLAMYNSSRMASEDSKERARTEGELYAERINGIISQIEQSVNTLSDAVSNDFDYEAFVKSKKYADEYTELITDAAVNFASHTDGAVTAYVRYNPQYSNPTSGIFMSRDSLNDEFTLLTPTDFPCMMRTIQLMSAGIISRSKQDMQCGWNHISMKISMYI